ncbi:DUF4157 domain-containing protein [Streptomyces zaomyceticus]|uniref:DUF4157 domain-containing protein n=1 Tax=Streptomyces zaomyceticus TaxID=68286 RepID=UPI00378BEF72
MLQLAGHPYAQPPVQRTDQTSEQHVHGAGCGHQQSEQPTVQRSTVHDVLAGTGRPLDTPLREEMEARLGADFSDVRIHDNTTARASATEIGARAYTSGNNVVIGDGGNDKHTLAHELTHVVQQRQGPVAGTDNGAGLRVSDPSDRFEREAEANATRALAGPVPDAVQRVRNNTAHQPLEAAAAADGTVQRYHAQPQEIRTAGGEGPHFQTQTPNAVLDDNHVDGQLPWAIDHEVTTYTPTADTPVNVLVSQDYTLAVLDSDNEPKEFYATAARLTEANEALAAAQSAIQLTAVGNTTITVDADGTPTTLQRVTAIRRGSAHQAAQFAGLVEHQCIRLAGGIIGMAVTQDFHRNDKFTQAPQRHTTPDGTVFDSKALANRLVDGPGAQAGDEATLGERYGMAHAGGELHDTEQLGANEHAAPGIGEAFGIYSIGQTGTPNEIDFAFPGGPAPSEMATWNYHFAGVVAQAGNDRVTLENYTRDDSFGDAQRMLYSELIVRYRETLMGKIKDLFGLGYEQNPNAIEFLRLLQELVTKEAASAGADARSEYARLVQDAHMPTRWFFRMYGTEQGQSFHEQQYGGGRNQLINPLTTRSRKP